MANNKTKFFFNIFYNFYSLLSKLCYCYVTGGGPQNSTLEVAIYQSVFFELNFNKAIILSILQIIICSILLIIGFISLKGSRYFEIQIDNFEYLFNKNKLISLIDFFIIIIFSFLFFSPPENP